MEKRMCLWFWKIPLFFLLCSILLSRSGCMVHDASCRTSIVASEEEGIDFTQELIFFEQWFSIRGEGGGLYSLINIDFPTYQFDGERGILVSLNSIFGQGEGKIDPLLVNIIVGSGASLSGSAGVGTASGLQGVTSLPFVMPHGFLCIAEVKKDGTLVLGPCAETIRFLDFSFPNPLPSPTFILRPREEKVFSVTQTTEAEGGYLKLILDLHLSSYPVRRDHCFNEPGNK